MSLQYIYIKQGTQIWDKADVVEKSNRIKLNTSLISPFSDKTPKQRLFFFRGFLADLPISNENVVRVAKPLVFLS